MKTIRLISQAISVCLVASCAVTELKDESVGDPVGDPIGTFVPVERPAVNELACREHLPRFRQPMALSRATVVPTRPTLTGHIELSTSADSSGTTTETQDPVDRYVVRILSVEGCREVHRFTETFGLTAAPVDGVLPFEVAPEHLQQLEEGNYVLILSLGESETAGVHPFRISSREFVCEDPNAGEFVETIEIEGDRVARRVRGERRAWCIDVIGGVRDLVVNGQSILRRAGPQSLHYALPSEVLDVVVSGSRGQIRIRQIGNVANARNLLEENWLCGGRLAGYLDYGINDTRRFIPREDMEVACRATLRTSARVESSLGSQANIFVDVSVRGVTDEDGRFQTQFTAADFDPFSIRNNSVLIDMKASCTRVSTCGIDSLPERVLEYNPPANRPDIDRNFGATIKDVPDLSFGRQVARLVTSDPNPYRIPNSAFNSVFSESAVSSRPKPNDLPLVIHEAFDALREDGANYLYWILSGQQIDLRKLGDEDTFFNSPCDGKVRGPCLPCTRLDESCLDVDVPVCRNNANNEVQGFRKPGYNMIGTLVSEGYDVWLVDSILHDQPVIELARRSPALYQRILDFPYRDVATSVDFAVTPFATGRPRQLAIGGVSAGGLVARSAIRMWELRDAIEADPNAPDALRLYHPNVELDSVSRVGLYLSFDSPHRGLLLPPGLQALVRDPNFPITNSESERLSKLLESDGLKELTRNYVEPPVETGCWSGDGVVDNCTFGPGNLPNTAGTGLDGVADSGDTRYEQSQALAVAMLDAFGEPKEHGVDGLPTTVPRVAISNGSHLSDPDMTTNELFEIDLNGIALIVVPIPPFLVPVPVNEHARLLAGDQGRGSGLAQMCDLKRGDMDPTGELVNPFENIDWYGAPVWAGYDVDVDITMRPGTGQAFPTLIPTRSALALDGPVRNNLQALGHRWTDAFTQELNEPHFTVNEDQCEFLMYHLDGFMRNDRDGYPACTGRETSCLGGARSVGFLQNPQGFEASEFCDPDDGDANVIPPIMVRRQIRELYEIGDLPLLEH